MLGGLRKIIRQRKKQQKPLRYLCTFIFIEHRRENEENRIFVFKSVVLYWLVNIVYVAVKKAFYSSWKMRISNLFTFLNGVADEERFMKIMKKQIWIKNWSNSKIRSNSDLTPKLWIKDFRVKASNLFRAFSKLFSLFSHEFLSFKAWAVINRKTVQWLKTVFWWRNFRKSIQRINFVLNKRILLKNSNFFNQLFSLNFRQISISPHTNFCLLNFHLIIKKWNQFRLTFEKKMIKRRKWNKKKSLNFS